MRPTRFRWFVVFLLFAITVVNYIDRAAISYAIPLIQKQLGFSATESGAILGAFGLGYAMAQDRLFQLDFLRRKGSGRLAEILGPASGELDFLVRMVGVPSVLDWDKLARTVGIRRLAEQEWTVLPEETRRVLTAFTNGINTHMEEAKDNLPIEFALLDYQPEPWSPIDSRIRRRPRIGTCECSR